MTPHFNHAKKTKIIATVGPACSAYEMLLELAKSGVNLFRLNFSHGSHEDHLQVIQNIAKINEEFGAQLGILADLQGPKLRIGKIEGNTMPIKPGDVLTFCNEECLGNMDKIYMSYTLFPKEVQQGDQVLVDDGKVVLEVLETDNQSSVKLLVKYGSEISSNKGVNLPDTQISLPALTDKDLADLNFILTQPVNWIALSFVRSPEDVKDLKRRIAKAGHMAKVISKIEKPAAVEKINKIIKASNAIMIARGDLGIEIPMEKLPGVQKDIIKRCIQRSRPVIVATQLMDSMIVNPSPTRAEVTDVANAVLDGADAVMLSGETSVGAHPIRVIQEMSKIITEAEKFYSFGQRRPEPSPKSSTFLSDVVCFNSAKAAVELNAKALVGMTASGYTAFKMASYRPDCNIYIFTHIPEMCATLSLVWGVTSYYYDSYASTDQTLKDTTDILLNKGHIHSGNIVVNTFSMPIDEKGRANTMKVSTVH
jgi:pyruvate kinase